MMELPVHCIEPARQGDRAARETLAEWCLRDAFRFAYLDLGGVPNRQELAEEIAGEASAKAIEHLDQYQSGTRFDIWLHQIVRNCARTRFRREDHAVPLEVYRRWVHDFVVSHEVELRELIQRECGDEPSLPHPALQQRIVTDLIDRTYWQFMRLSYEGRAGSVLKAVKQWLRTFVGVEWAPLYEQDAEGEWVERELPGEDETSTQVLRRELVQRVNDLLAQIAPLCRRILRWYYLDDLRVTDIAHLEKLSERTVYRRIENCSASLRARLAAGGYMEETDPSNGDPKPPRDRLRSVAPRAKKMAEIGSRDVSP
jgi:RNA polymerase sigma factor (sigma-70 family)